MAKITLIRAYEDTKHVKHIQVDFGDIDRHHAMALFPAENYIDFAHRLHEFADQILHDPHLKSNEKDQGLDAPRKGSK